MDSTAARYLEYMTHMFYNYEYVILADFESLDADELETIYALGYNCFLYGKYEAARGIFENLTVDAPDTGYYWRALGAVHQQIGNYPEAIAAYDKAINNDEMDIVSRVYRAESLILSGGLQDGLEGLKQVVKLGSDWEEAKPWLNRAEFLLGIHGMTGLSKDRSSEIPR